MLSAATPRSSTCSYTRSMVSNMFAGVSERQHHPAYAAADVDIPPLHLDSEPSTTVSILPTESCGKPWVHVACQRSQGCQSLSLKLQLCLQACQAQHTLCSQLDGSADTAHHDPLRSPCQTPPSAHATLIVAARTMQGSGLVSFRDTMQLACIQTCKPLTPHASEAEPEQTHMKAACSLACSLAGLQLSCSEIFALISVINVAVHLRAGCSVAGI